MYKILIIDDEKMIRMGIESSLPVGELKDSELIPLGNMEKEKELYRDIYVKLKKSMCANVGNPDYVMRVYDTFSNATVSYNLPVESIRSACFDLASAVCFTYIHSIGGTSAGRLDELLKNIIYANGTEACEMTRQFLFNMFGKDKASTHDVISRVIRYIDEHLTDPISVSSIAVQFYITPNYLSRLFKKIMGEGCNEYIVRKRIEKARYLLETSNMKTGKIACMVGYRDTNYFSLAFKKHTGKSPTKYREEMR